MTPKRTLLGRYHLIRKLGAGGMGSVWLAEDRQLERKVAVKELVPGSGEDLHERRARALREAVALARVRHPAIVSIHDVLTVDDKPWIVMEYIDGRGLDSIITDTAAQGGSLDERMIARVGLPVLRGLCAAHEANVVHRDVKPANILVSGGESVFLVDFGIAKIAGDITLTGYRRIMGTPEFLAPERLNGGVVGPSSDLWSLGVTFFYALEGYSPFRRGGELSPEATVAAILYDDPPGPRRQGPLADVILRLLVKDPRRRAGASELATVLQSIKGGVPVPQPMRPVPASRPGPAPVPPRRPRAAQPPGHPAPAPVATRRGARGGPAEEIRGAGTAAGAEMLLDMPEDEAARILASYEPEVRGALLQGVATVRPDMASAILQLLSTADISRSMNHIRPETAASILAALPSDDAVQVLNRIGARRAAEVIMKMPASVSAPLARAMSGRRAAEVLSYASPSAVAAMLPAMEGSGARLLQLLDPWFRTQVMRLL